MTCFTIRNFVKVCYYFQSMVINYGLMPYAVMPYVQNILHHTQCLLIYNTGSAWL